MLCKEVIDIFFLFVVVFVVDAVVVILKVFISWFVILFLIGRHYKHGLF